MNSQVFQQVALWVGLFCAGAIMLSVAVRFLRWLAAALVAQGQLLVETIHALLVAAHSWAHEPFRRALDLVDVSALSLGADDQMLASLARCWGIERMWDATTRVSAAMLGHGFAPPAVRPWARNVLRLEERTVFQVHLTRWLSPYAARSPVAALHSSAAARRSPSPTPSGAPPPTTSWRRATPRRRRRCATRRGCARRRGTPR